MIQTLVEPYIRFFRPSSLAFPTLTYTDRPALKTVIEYQGKTGAQFFYSIIDSGADTCVFPAMFGQSVGINVTSGPTEGTQGIGSGTTYYHNVQVWVEVEGKPYQFNCYAGFMVELNQTGVGFLGRRGFFDMFQSIAFDPQNSQVEFKVNIP